MQGWSLDCDFSAGAYQLGIWFTSDRPVTTATGRNVVLIMLLEINKQEDSPLRTCWLFKTIYC